MSQETQTTEQGGGKRPSLQRYTVIFFGIALLFAIVAGLMEQRNQRLEDYYSGLLEEKNLSLSSHLSLAEQLQQQLDVLIGEYAEQEQQLARSQAAEAEAAASIAATDLLLQIDRLIEQGKEDAATLLLGQLDEGALTPEGERFKERLEGQLKIGD